MIPGVDCSSCVYFSPAPHGGAAFGQCRFLPPQLHFTDDGKLKTAWPLVGKSDFCGSHATPENEDSQ